MPYNWVKHDPSAESQEMHLWPHQSLRPGGFVLFMTITLLLLLLPLVAVMGSALLWGVLPFLALAVGGLWLALKANWRQRHILEVLTLTANRARLIRRGSDGAQQEWDCNRYWARPEIYATGGPVPNYVTLRGGDREVEIGAFLSEDERKKLFGELSRVLPGR